MKNKYYKYRPLYQPGNNGDRVPHHFTESIFKNKKIYFGAPKDFNDPYDSNFRLHVRDSTDAEWIAHINELIPMDTALGAQEKWETFKEQKLWKTIPEVISEFDKIAGEMGQEIYKNSSVFCFSKKDNSIPMFSYYADYHSGIAIEFSFSDSEIPCGVPFGSEPPPYGGKDGGITFGDVKYTDSFPELNFHKLRNTRDLPINLMFVKYDKWAHEEEVRIFRRKHGAAAVPFKPSLITKVIFGCKTIQTEVALVKGWLKDWPSDVVLSKATPAPDRFELLIKDFETIKGISVGAHGENGA